MSRARRILAALLTLAALTTAGCAQLLSANEQALIVGAGLDRGAGPGQVQATLQWYHHGKPTPGGPSGGGGGSHLISLSATAAGTAAAVAGVAAQTDQRVTFASDDLVILGGGLARRGVTGPVNFLWRNGTFPESADVAIAIPTAAALLASPFPGGIALELGRRLVRSTGTDTGSIPIPIWRLLARAATPGEAAWAPIFRPTAQGFAADGTALFQGDRMTGTIGQRQTAALSWLLKSGGYGELFVPQLPGPDGEPAALAIAARTLRKTVADTTRAQLDLTLQATVRQAPDLVLQGRDPAGVEAAAARQAEVDVASVVAAMQAAGSDLLGLGGILRERDPAAVGADWPFVFRRMRIDVRVTVRVVAGGRGA